MRKPVLRLGQTGFLGAGGKSLHEVFKGLTSDELDRLRGPNLYLLASFGIYPSARLARGDFEGAKSDKLNGLGLFNAGFDAVDNGVHGALSVGFTTSEGFLDGGNEFNFVHLGKKVRKKGWRLVTKAAALCRDRVGVSTIQRDKISMQCPAEAVLAKGCSRRRRGIYNVDEL